MADSSPFASFVPGFDFIQGLVSNAGAALPGIGQWVAPTLNPQELEKRIEELRTIQFWLEQNGRMVGATIQALEVQRMTLTTLQTMNVQMEDLRDSLKIKPLSTSPAATPKAAPAESAPVAQNFFSGPPAGSGDTAAPPAAPATSAAPPPGVDPMQWWGALTQQFTQLATQAMKKGAEDVSKHMASLKTTGADQDTAPAPAKAATAPRARPPAAGKAGSAKPVKAPARARPKASKD